MSRYSYKNFLPAKDLKLSGAEKRAMVAVLKKLDTGEITDEAKLVGRRRGRALQMATVFQRAECGTVGCIAGYMSVELGLRGVKRGGLYSNLAARSEALHDLVNARETRVLSLDRSFMYSAEAKHGARALRSFLRTGKPQWIKAMGKDA